MFESGKSESVSAAHEGEDDELKRLSQNRSSIAERRRLYEARSVSGVPEEKVPQSPLPTT